MAALCGPHNIRVNCVCPTAIDTKLIRDPNLDPEEWPRERQDFAEKHQLLKRVGQPEDVAKAILFLTTDDSAFITGSALMVDAGTLAII